MPNTYDVYFGLPENLVLISEDQIGLSVVVPSVLEYNTTYNWRIDTDTVAEVITGDVWAFTTLVFTPPVPTGINNMITLKRIVAAANNKIFYET